MKYQSKINDLYRDMTSSVKGIVLKDEPLKNHTYFKIGGPAGILAEPEDTEDLVMVLKLIKKHGVDYFVIGNGTNLLVSDEGFNGAVVKICDKFSYFKRNENRITAGAGVLLSCFHSF